MRSQPRIASLITAIGVSLLLQYGGQIFLLEGKPQNIDPKVSPFYSSDPNVGNFILTLKGPDATLAKAAEALQAEADSTKATFDEQLKKETGGEFDLSPEGKRLRDLSRDAARQLKDAKDKANAGTVAVSLPKGQVIMLGTVLILMTGLTYLVMFTKPGRAMRAVSLDFDTASMMGINVNTIVTFTFVLGSGLAGAGAMMAATFQSGTKIDTFFGVMLGTKAFVAAVLGGIGNIPGAVLGGLLMGVAEILVVWSGYDGYKDAIAFVLLIAVLLFRPGGLLGSSKVEKV
jgi:branched-chain amino acid transport system permease protein